MKRRIGNFTFGSRRASASKSGCGYAASTASMHLSSDCREFIALLRSEDVDFLIVGAAALAAHGRPRYSGDVDIWIRCDVETAARMERVIHGFGFGSTGLCAADFAQPDQVIQLGVAPNRIDILTGLTGLDFEGSWRYRAHLEFDGMTLPFIDRECLRKNKLSTGRPQDLADAAEMDRLRG
jgi:hypothetical protein